MSAADGMITAGRALGAGEVPGPVFSSPFQVIVFLACCECAALKKLAPRRLLQLLLLLLLLLLFAPFVVRSPFLFAVVWRSQGVWLLSWRSFLCSAPRGRSSKTWMAMASMT